MPINVNLTYRANLSNPLTWAQGDANFKTLADNDLFLNGAVETAQQTANGKQAASTKLTAIASSVWAANQIIFITGTNTIVTKPATEYSIGLLTSDSANSFKIALSLDNVNNTPDMDKPVSTPTQSALDLKINTSQKGVANGVAALGADGKLPVSQLPPLAVNDTFVVNSQSEQLALVAQRGDMAFRTDQSNTPYVLTTDNPAIFSNWRTLDKTLSDSLAALNVLTPANDRIPFFTSALTAGLLAVGAVGKALIAATDKALGRSAIDAAKSGVNSDITELNGLTSPIPIAQGGVSSGYIQGLIPVWNSSTSITLGTGSAWIPGISKNVVVTSPLTLSPISLTSNTWYYLYLYDNAGAPAIELVTTPPAAPYSGTARIKTGDSSRRFVHAVKSNTGVGMHSFQVDAGGFVRYRALLSASPFRIVTGANQTAPTTVSVRDLVPMTTQTALLISIQSGTPVLFIGLPADSTAVFNRVSPGAQIPMTVILDEGGQFSFWNSTTGGAATFDIAGYGLDR